jgi:hypothetical protein
MEFIFNHILNMKRQAMQQMNPGRKGFQPGLRQSVQNFISNPGQSAAKLPGVRNNIRQGLLNFGKPIYNAARTGLDLLGKADKTLERLGDADIPILSDIVDIARSDPRYKFVTKGF